MKKLFLIPVAFVGMLLLASCAKSDDPAPTPTPSYLDVLLADHATILQNYPEFANAFREAQYELNGLVSETPAEDLKPVSVNYVYAYTDMVEHNEPLLQVFRDFTTGADLVYHYSHATSPYEGSAPIDPTKAKISLEEALQLVKKANVVPPETRFVTFRQYVYKDLPNIYYIFGGKQDREIDIYVDAITGEVLSFTND